MYSVYNYEQGGSDYIEITKICPEQNSLEILQKKTMLVRLNTPYDSHFHKKPLKQSENDTNSISTQFL